MLLTESQRITFQFHLSRDYYFLVEYLNIPGVSYSCLYTRNQALIIYGAYNGLRNLFRVVTANIIINID